jgi:hypothetical protein
MNANRSTIRVWRRRWDRKGLLLAAPLGAAGGCGPAPEDTWFVQEVTQTKREGEVAAVKSAAESYLREHVHCVPTQISSLPRFSYARNDIECESDGTNCVQTKHHHPDDHDPAIRLPQPVAVDRVLALNLLSLPLQSSWTTGVTLAGRRIF